ncbi:uncharacterized protein DMAD_12759 [Drosophila madeirensis]|uniref:Uncharacterized protein n=1 Tax=Drosophila madeirensis TaxID=30013 RepID=A0AAU9FHW2_DROMD
MISTTNVIHKSIGVVGALALLVIVTNSTALVIMNSSDGLAEMVASVGRFIDRFRPVAGVPVVLDCEHMGPMCPIIRRIGRGLYRAGEIAADAANTWAEPPPNASANIVSGNSVTTPRAETSKRKASSANQENPNNKRKSTKQAAHTGEHFRLQ